jgi:hypothetical protein
MSPSNPDVQVNITADVTPFLQQIRKPIRWCTYPGEITLDQVEPARCPNTLNELLYPVTATYDPDTNKTRVGWSYIAPPKETAP